MSDIKLFKINTGTLEGLDSDTFTFERDLQKLIEDNMEVVLGIKFLQSEYATGKEHRGRIDSLGIDENYCPIIIEYKRSTNENVINQGLFYLDWLMDHKAAFQLLVTEKLGQEDAGKIEWSTPRLLCIASGFTKYDVHAVKQMDRDIELIRYKKYNDDILLLEQVIAGYTNTSDKASKKNQELQGRTQSSTETTFGKQLDQIDDNLRNLYLAITDFIESLGDDIQRKELKYYEAFKRLKNFINIRIRPQKKILRLYLYLDPKKVDLSNNLVEDVPAYCRWRTKGLQVTLSNKEDFEQIKHLIVKSYEAN